MGVYDSHAGSNQWSIVKPKQDFCHDQSKDFHYHLKINIYHDMEKNYSQSQLV